MNDMPRRISVPKAALRIVLIYLVVGFAWIITSSNFVHVTVEPAYQGAFEIAKGFFFVLVTGILLYFMIKQTFASIATLTRQVTDKAAFLDLALEAGKSAAYEWLPHENSVAWSPSVQQLSGAEDAVSSFWQPNTNCVVDPDDREQLQAKVQEALTLQGRFEVLLRVKDKSGRWRCYENRGQVVESDSDKVKVVGVVSDLTDRVELDDRIRQLTESLDEEVRQRTENLSTLNRELESFNHAVAHDLRSPLRAIQGYASILRNESATGLDEEGKETLERIVVSSSRLAAMFDGLQRLGRVGRQEVVRSEVDLSQLASELVSAMKEEQPTCNDVAVTIQPGLVAEADSQLIQLVLRNLLENACKFVPHRQGTVVEFGCENVGEDIHYFVRDNGPGFAPEEAERIFQPFRRGKGAAATTGQGIGLATVASAIRRMGGRVWAESKPGEGATFWFTLAG